MAAATVTKDYNTIIKRLTGDEAFTNAAYANSGGLSYVINRTLDKADKGGDVSVDQLFEITKTMLQYRINNWVTKGINTSLKTERAFDLLWSRALYAWIARGGAKDEERRRKLLLLVVTLRDAIKAKTVTEPSKVTTDGVDVVDDAIAEIEKKAPSSTDGGGGGGGASGGSGGGDGGAGGEGVDYATLLATIRPAVTSNVAGTPTMNEAWLKQYSGIALSALSNEQLHELFSKALSDNRKTAWKVGTPKAAEPSIEKVIALIDAELKRRRIFNAKDAEAVRAAIVATDDWNNAAAVEAFLTTLLPAQPKSDAAAAVVVQEPLSKKQETEPKSEFDVLTTALKVADVNEMTPKWLGAIELAVDEQQLSDDDLVRLFAVAMSNNDPLAWNPDDINATRIDRAVVAIANELKRRNRWGNDQNAIVERKYVDISKEWKDQAKITEVRSFLATHIQGKSAAESTVAAILSDAKPALVEKSGGDDELIPATADAGGDGGDGGGGGGGVDKSIPIAAGDGGDGGGGWTVAGAASYLWSIAPTRETVVDAAKSTVNVAKSAVNVTVSAGATVLTFANNRSVNPTDVDAVLPVAQAAIKNVVSETAAEAEVAAKDAEEARLESEAAAKAVANALASTAPDAPTSASAEVRGLKSTEAAAEKRWLAKKNIAAKKAAEKEEAERAAAKLEAAIDERAAAAAAAVPAEAPHNSRVEQHVAEAIIAVARVEHEHEVHRRRRRRAEKCAEEEAVADSLTAAAVAAAPRADPNAAEESAPSAAYAALDVLGLGRVAAPRGGGDSETFEQYVGADRDTRRRRSEYATPDERVALAGIAAWHTRYWMQRIGEWTTRKDVVDALRVAVSTRPAIRVQTDAVDVATVIGAEPIARRMPVVREELDALLDEWVLLAFEQHESSLGVAAAARALVAFGVEEDDVDGRVESIRRALSGSDERKRSIIEYAVRPMLRVRGDGIERRRRPALAPVADEWRATVRASFARAVAEASLKPAEGAALGVDDVIAEAVDAVAAHFEWPPTPSLAAIVRGSEFDLARLDPETVVTTTRTRATTTDDGAGGDIVLRGGSGGGSTVLRVVVDERTLWRATDAAHLNAVRAAYADFFGAATSPPRRRYVFRWRGGNGSRASTTVYEVDSATTPATTISSECRVSATAINDGVWACDVELQAVYAETRVVAARGRSASVRVRVVQTCVRCRREFDADDTRCTWTYAVGDNKIEAQFVGRHSATTRHPDTLHAWRTPMPSSRLNWGVNFERLAAQHDACTDREVRCRLRRAYTFALFSETPIDLGVEAASAEHFWPELRGAPFIEV
jgi:hypothetical protein